MKTHYSFALVAALSIFAMHGAAQAGLVAYWNFDEGSGTNVADSSSNGNDGTVVGTLTWVPGQTGGAGDFALSFPNNAANYVSVPDDPSLHIHTHANQNFTLAAWVYNKGSVYGALYGQGTGGTRHMELQTQNGVSGDVPYIWSDTTGGPQLAFGAVTEIDAWTHMAVTSDGTNLRTYLNGVLDTTSAAPAGVSPADWGSVMLGREVRSANHALNGYLDDVVVFDSVEDITQIMNGTHPAMIGAPFVITEIDYAPDADPNPTVTLTWSKSGAASYIVKVSTDMSNWGEHLYDSITEEDDENTEDTEHITATFPLEGNRGDAAALFFRIEGG